MAMTAIDAVHEHMNAINTKRRDDFAATIAFPFVHVEPNGDKVFYASEQDVPNLSGIPFARAEIEHAEVVATSGELLVYLLRFQRYDEDENPTLVVQALWGAHKVTGEWKIGWRQYLGEIGATSHPSLLTPLGSKTGP